MDNINIINDGCLIQADNDSDNDDDDDDEMLKIVECMYLVIQRICSGSRLLINNNKWINIPYNGLVNYIGFGYYKIIKSNNNNNNSSSSSSSRYNNIEGKHLLNKERMTKAARSLLTCKLGSNSGWQSDHSDADSIINLCKYNNATTTTNVLVTIPQASLAGVCIPGDKYMKYHYQLDKDRSYKLYNEWLLILHNEIRTLLNPNKYNNIIGMQKYLKRMQDNNNKTSLIVDDPKMMFKVGEYSGKYSKYDDNGLPLLMADGTNIPKSRLKKLNKIYNVEMKKWLNRQEKEKGNDIITRNNSNEKKKYGNNNNDDNNNNNNSEMDNEIMIDEAELGSIYMVNGTFSGRQGWHMISNGPFTHQLTF